MTGEPYNPLDKFNLGESIAKALLLQSVLPLGNVSGLVGAGVYAIYYTGNFSAYSPIAQKNLHNKFLQPIYVGKAVPKGSRKGGLSSDSAVGTSMRDRLRGHAKSIGEVSNINLSDFFCRALMVDDIWIPLGENMMIEQYRPIWNVVIDGFGNKTPGVRRPQNRSQWDVLHPGRKLARNLVDGGTTVEMILNRLDLFFGGHLEVLLTQEQETDSDDEEI